MALAPHAVKALAPYLKNAKVLSLGYPDILASVEECQKIFGVTPVRTVNAGKQHGIQRPLVETVELFRLLGSTLECVDVMAWRGCERVLNLNDPQSFGEFDLVIDPGTTEHCFNIGQAILNGASAVKVGGRIYHSPPVSMMNHGFYNVCPTALQDFYEQNGWEIELFEARVKGSEIASPISHKHAWSRSFAVERESGLIFMAKRVNNSPLKWPIQKKYLLMAGK